MSAHASVRFAIKNTPRMPTCFAAAAHWTAAEAVLAHTYRHEQFTSASRMAQHRTEHHVETVMTPSVANSDDSLPSIEITRSTLILCAITKVKNRSKMWYSNILLLPRPKKNSPHRSHANTSCCQRWLAYAKHTAKTRPHGGPELTHV